MLIDWRKLDLRGLPTSAVGILFGLTVGAAVYGLGVLTGFLPETPLMRLQRTVEAHVAGDAERTRLAVVTCRNTAYAIPDPAVRAIQLAAC